MKKEGKVYKARRELLKQKRELRQKILGTDNARQRVYSELTATKRAIKIEAGLSKSKSAATGGKETSIELFVEDILNELKVAFIKQKRFKYVNYDFWLKDLNIIIQTNSCWHHFCRVCYGDEPKHDVHLRAIKQDEEAKKIAEEAKVPYYEVWWHEIQNEPEGVKERIKKLCQKEQL